MRLTLKLVLSFLIGSALGVLVMRWGAEAPQKTRGAVEATSVVG